MAVMSRGWIAASYDPRNVSSVLVAKPSLPMKHADSGVPRAIVRRA